MNRTITFLALCTVCTLGWMLPAHAESVDQIVELHQKGLGEEVLLAAIERSTEGYSLSTDDIIKLKDAGVSEKVIAAMLRNKAKAPASPAGEAPMEIKPAQKAAAIPAGRGTLNIENVDDKAWAYKLDADNKIVWIVPGGNGDKALLARGGISLGVDSGRYTVRYSGQNDGYTFDVRPGEKSLLLLSRVETTDFEGLYISAFQDGERQGGGRLAVLRQSQPAAPKNTNVEGRTYSAGSTTGQTSYEYIPPAEKAAPAERVIERERVVYTEPARTVIYRDTPTYVYPYYYGGYYSPYCYPYSYHRYHHHHHHGHVGVRFGNYGRRSSWSVGIGVGF